MIVVKDLKKNYNGLDVLKGIDLTCLLYTSDAADE